MTGKGYTFFQIVPRQPKEANDYACAAFHLATQGLNILSRCEKHRLVPVFQSDFMSPFAWTLPKPVNIHNSVHFLSLCFSYLNEFTNLHLELAKAKNLQLSILGLIFNNLE